MNAIKTLMISALVVCVAVPAAARGRDKRGAKASGAAMLEVREAAREILEREGGLSAKAIEVIQRQFEQVRTQRHQLRRELRQQMQALREMLDAGSRDDAAYTKVIDGIAATRVKMDGLRDLQIAELRRQLTPVDQARLIVVLPKLRKTVRHAMHKARKGRLEQELHEMEDEPEE